MMLPISNSPDHETQLKDTQQHPSHRSTQWSVPELVIFYQGEYGIEMGKLSAQNLRQSGHLVFQDCSAIVQEKCKQTEAAILAVSVEATSHMLHVTTREVVPKNYQAMGAMVKSLAGGRGLHLCDSMIQDVVFGSCV